MRYILYLLLAQLAFAALQVHVASKELSRLVDINIYSSRKQGTVIDVSFERTKTTRRLWYTVAVDDNGEIRKVNTPGYLSNQVEREYHIGEAVEVHLSKEEPCRGYMFIPQMQTHYANERQYYLYFSGVIGSICVLLIVVIKFKGWKKIRPKKG